MSDRWLDRTWRPFGERDAYFGVLTDERFRSDRMGPDDRRAFFESGERHVAWIMEQITQHVAPDFRAGRVLDFGCGVGRLTLPFARIATEAVGADVSAEMLREATHNAEREGLTNVTLVQSDDTLRTITGPFDLVHSFIVFQHIPPARGAAIAFGLVDRLSPGGVGALHFTYARAASLGRKVVHRLRKSVPGVNALANVALRRPPDEPFIPMYNYKLDRLIEGLRERGCGAVHLLLTDHGGHHGAVLLFRRDGGQ